VAAPISRRGGVLKHRHDMSDESVPPYGRAREIRHLSRASVRDVFVRHVSVRHASRSRRRRRRRCHAGGKPRLYKIVISSSDHHQVNQDSSRSHISTRYQHHSTKRALFIPLRVILSLASTSRIHFSQTKMSSILSHLKHVKPLEGRSNYHIWRSAIEGIFRIEGL